MLANEWSLYLVMPGRFGPARLLYSKKPDAQLPVEFETELHTSRRICRGDCPEVTVSEIRVRLKEARVIQRIEHLKAELQSPRLAKVPPFLYAHVPVKI